MSDISDQLQPEDTLIDRGVDDILDEGIIPPDRPGPAYEEPGHHDTIEERIRQEVPDPDSAYGAPDNESGLDRPGDEAYESEVAPVGSRRAGRLVAPDEGFGEDVDDEPYALDVGIDGGAASAEEAAMHILDE